MTPIGLPADHHRILSAVPGSRDPLAQRLFTIADKAGMGVCDIVPTLSSLIVSGFVQQHGKGRNISFSRTPEGDKALRDGA